MSFYVFPHSHHAAGHVFGHGHAASGFLSGVGHTMFNSLIYAAMFRIVRHIPWPMLIVIIGVVVFLGWRHARATGRRPW